MFSKLFPIQEIGLYFQFLSCPWEMLGYKGKIDFFKEIAELCGTLIIEY